MRFGRVRPRRTLSPQYGRRGWGTLCRVGLSAGVVGVGRTKKSFRGFTAAGGLKIRGKYTCRGHRRVPLSRDAEW